MKTPTMTTKQLSLSLSMSERQIQRIIKKLKDSDKIRRVGSDRNGYWETL